MKFGHEPHPSLAHLLLDFTTSFGGAMVLPFISSLPGAGLDVLLLSAISHLAHGVVERV